jgi:hypothetical protein
LPSLDLRFMADIPHMLTLGLGVPDKGRFVAGTHLYFLTILSEMSVHPVLSESMDP